MADLGSSSSAGKTIAVAATASFGARLLDELARAHKVEVLITKPDRPYGRGRRIESSAAKKMAENLGIPVLQPESLDADLDFSADVVVVAAYGVLIPQSLLSERLWLNVHPSLLPRWRGAAPVERALMAGDDVTGVTVHLTTVLLDAGPILLQESFGIEPGDDAGAIYDRSVPIATRLINEVLLAQSGEIIPEEQLISGVTYAEKIGSADRELDWEMPATQIVNHVRALSPHIGAWGIVEDRRLIIWRARQAKSNESDGVLRVGDVVLLEVQPEGRRRMSADQYVHGYR